MKLNEVDYKYVAKIKHDIKLYKESKRQARRKRNFFN